MFQVPVQNLHTDGSELQLVTVNRPEQELNKNDNTLTLPRTGNALTLPYTGNALTLPRTGNAMICPHTGNILLYPHTSSTLLLPHTGNIPECGASQNAECSNGLMEMELGADEVFVISNTDTSFSPCTVHTHLLYSKCQRNIYLLCVQ